MTKQHCETCKCEPELSRTYVCTSCGEETPRDMDMFGNLLPSREKHGAMVRMPQTFIDVGGDRSIIKEGKYYVNVDVYTSMACDTEPLCKKCLIVAVKLFVAELKRIL